MNIPLVLPLPLVGEGAPLNWRPSADAVAGNGWDEGTGGVRLPVPYVSLSPPPSPSPIKGEGIEEGESSPEIA